MTFDRRRLFLTLTIAGLSALAGIVAYVARERRGPNPLALLASAQRMLRADDDAGALIQLDKLLALRPNHAKAHFLKGRTLLGDRDPGSLRSTDSQAMEALRSLLRAVRPGSTRLDDRDLGEAHALLADYFHSVGDAVEAGAHARAALRSRPNDAQARYLAAASLLDVDRPTDAFGYVKHLLLTEAPLRPRTAWLAVRLADLDGRQVDWDETAVAAVARFALDRLDGDSLDDLLGLASLHAWHASRTDDPDAVNERVRDAIKALSKALEREAPSDATPRRLLAIAQRLIPATDRKRVSSRPVHAEIELEVTALIERIDAWALQAEVLDPVIYLAAANRLVDKGAATSANEIVRRAISIARVASPEARAAFEVCDLWLAEHLLAEGRFEEAEPYLRKLRTSERFRPWGALLTGYRLVRERRYDSAAAELTEAVAALPEHGTAHALLGLCQLRRGFVSEARERLECAVVRGADRPEYKAWLALALAEAGYRDEAMRIAREALDDPATRGIGAALIGRLRLSAGQWDQAERDLQVAWDAAPPEARPGLRLAQAELALARGDREDAEGILEELKQTSAAPQAFAILYAHRSQSDPIDAAYAVLIEGRSACPDDAPLLALHVEALVRRKRHGEALEVIEGWRARNPDSPASALLLSEVHDAAGDGAAALEALRVADRTDQGILEIRLVEKLLDRRRFDAADELLVSLATSPSVLPAALDYLRARSAFLQGRDDDGERILRRAAEADPDNPTLKFLLGQLAARDGDHRTASRLFEQTLYAGVAASQARKALFDALLRSGATDRAIDLLGQAERSGRDVRAMRARLLQSLARGDDAAALDRELAALLQDSPTETDIALATSVLRTAGRPAEALQLLDHWLDRFAESPVLSEQQVTLLLVLEEYEEADRTVAELLERNPADPSIHRLRIGGLLMSHRFEPALEAAVAAWSRCPGDASIESLRVQTLLRLERRDEALRLAAEARERFPSLPHPDYLVARMYEALGRVEEAIEHLALTVDQEPENAQAVQHYVRLLASGDRAEELEAVLHRLLDANSEDPNLLGMLAEFHASHEEIPKARVILTKLTRLGVTGTMVAYLRGVVAFAEDDLQRAEREIQAPLSEPRGHVPSELLMARILFGRGRSQEAFDRVESVRRRRPAQPLANLLHGQLLIELGRVEQAEAFCRERLETRPGDRSYDRLLVEVLHRKNDAASRDEALVIAKTRLSKGTEGAGDFERYLGILLEARDEETVAALRAQVIDGERSDLLLAAARAHLRADRFADAVALAQRGIEVAPSDATARLLLADALSARSRSSGDRAGFERAVRAYRAVLRSDPRNQVAANNLAWTLGIDLGEPREAIEELIERVPEADGAWADLPAELLDTLGALRLNLNHLAEAQRLLEAAIERRPETAISHFHLGRAYERQQRHERARSSYREALRLDPEAPWAHRIEPSMLAN